MSQLDSKNTGKNKELGLPHSEDGKMEKVAFCFDIDGTLINGDEKYPNTIKLLVVLAEQKWKNVKVVVWSGGGREYAETFVRRLGLENHVDMLMGKLEHPVLTKMGYKIVAVDDIQDTRLGIVNMIVRNK
jgi:hydroxymethylpyrimidine pyrophosphatase-like HAD family hydrolase